MKAGFIPMKEFNPPRHSGFHSEFLGWFFLAIFLFSLPVLLLAGEDDICLVIGEKLDPVKARGLLMEALQNWRTGRSTRALDLYEQALLADRSVLAQNDDGMGVALLLRIEKQAETATPTPGFLCRKGFFKNIISGNLESAVDHYRRASEASGPADLQQAARREAGRLGQELAYVNQWQATQKKRIIKMRRRDEANRLVQERAQGREDRIAALQDELDELDARLSYLQDQESNSSSRLFATIKRRSRARRYYYYNDNPSPTISRSPQPYPGPGLGQIPFPAPGAPSPLVSVEPGPLPTGFDPQPLQDTPPVQLPPAGTGIVTSLPDSPLPSEQASNQESDFGSPDDLNSYYRYRNDAKDEKRELDQIRAEISGIERRQKAIAKEIETIRKASDLEFKPLSLTPRPASSTMGSSWKPQTIQ